MTLTEVAPLTADEKIVVLQHDSAVEFLDATYPTLRQHERSSHLLLAHALKRAPAEYVLTECQYLTEADVQLPPYTQPIPAHNFWLTVWSQPAKSMPVLDMVLSCLDSSLGKQPIFLWTRVEQSLPPPQWLSRRVGDMAAHLHACVEPERVFSVFGVHSLVNAFVNAWTGLTGLSPAPDPLYTAYSAFCTQQTLKSPVSAAAHMSRKANITDVNKAARLCEEFANSSVCSRLSSGTGDVLTALA